MSRFAKKATSSRGGPGDRKADTIIEVPPKAPKFPPFARSSSLVDDVSPTDLDRNQVKPGPKLSWAIPACFVKNHQGGGPGGREVRIIHMQDLPEYFRHDLDLSPYQLTQKYLWWATWGLYSLALHQYLNRGFSIMSTEAHDEHEVIKEKQKLIFLKPLPDYLLSYSIWESYLCRDDHIYSNALGLLRSYLILVRTKSDFKIAQEIALLAPEISWEKWTYFSHSALPNCDLRSCHPRYLYGPLDEWHLTWIHRLSPETFSVWDITSPYMGSTFSVSSFVQEKTKWLLGALFYITIVLTAMQVGLMTDELSTNMTFTRAAYGFTVSSILAPLIVLSAVVCTAIIQEIGYTADGLRDRKVIRKLAGT